MFPEKLNQLELKRRPAKCMDALRRYSTLPIYMRSALQPMEFLRCIMQPQGWVSRKFNFRLARGGFIARYYFLGKPQHLPVSWEI